MRRSVFRRGRVAHAAYLTRGYTARGDAPLRGPDRPERGRKDRRRPGQRPLLRRDGGGGLGIRGPDPRGRGSRGRARDRQRALARLRGPARVRGARGPARLGPRPRRGRAGDARRCAPRSSSCAGPASPTTPTASRASPSTSADGSGAPTGTRTSSCGSSTARGRAGKATSSTSRCECSGSGGAPARRAPPLSLRRHQRPPAQDRPLHDALGAAVLRGGAPHRPPEHGRRRALGLLPELRREARLSPGHARARHLDPERLLHVREAGQAPRAPAGGLPLE